jgi:hypothetical protein
VQQSALRPWLEALEATAEGDRVAASAALAFVAGHDVVRDVPELNAARRRAVLLLAAGGDPRRELGIDDRAVTALAADLASDERSAAFGRGLAALRGEAAGLSRATRAIDELLGDRDLAWSALACALLAEELAEDD